MNRGQEEGLKVTLTTAIEDWLESIDTTLPWMGDDIAEIMAAAAFQVLRGIADSQVYLKREGMLKENEL